MNIKLAILGTFIVALSHQTLAETTIPKTEILTGDARTACEVILCLSSSQGKGIKECQAPLRKYFSIRAKKWHKTLAKRRSFLDLCPAANENAKMSALTTAIQHQEYACDAATLNSRTETRRSFGVRRLVRTQSYMPDFCKALYDHEFTEYKHIQKPKFVCDKNKWYSKVDWKRGFERIEMYRKWNPREERYDIQYKEVPIQKNCWQ